MIAKKMNRPRQLILGVNAKSTLVGRYGLESTRFPTDPLGFTVIGAAGSISSV